MFDITKVNWKKVGIFASGVLFGTAGIKALSSKDAKNVYTNCTAAVLRAKDCVMKTATNIQENAEDIYRGIYETYLRTCIGLIREDKIEQCRKVYTDMVYELEDKYFS